MAVTALTPSTILSTFLSPFSYHRFEEYCVSLLAFFQCVAQQKQQIAAVSYAITNHTKHQKHQTPNGSYCPHTIDHPFDIPFSFLISQIWKISFLFVAHPHIIQYFPIFSTPSRTTTTSSHPLSFAYTYLIILYVFVKCKTTSSSHNIPLLLSHKKTKTFL